MRILLVDDNIELGNLLREYFATHEADLEDVTNGGDALTRLASESFDAVLLDVMLPGDDGFQVCRSIRRVSDVPIVMLTARGDDTNRIVGLDLGADDYLPKPFNPRELLSRVRAVLRRARPAAVKDGGRLQVGNLAVDVPGQRVSVGGAPVHLTSFEFRLLVELARRAGETIGREDLARLLRGGQYNPTVDRSLDVHVSHLRSKLGDDARDPKRIRTVRGVGYVLLRPS